MLRKRMGIFGSILLHKCSITILSAPNDEVIIILFLNFFFIGLCNSFAKLFVQVIPKPRLCLVEIAFVVGREAKYIRESEAQNYILGYCLVNDVTEREFQKNRGLTWDKGKGFVRMPSQ